jgi:hypothetical protein
MGHMVLRRIAVQPYVHEIPYCTTHCFSIYNGLCSNEAALLAARHNKTAVEMADFEEAISRIVAGLEKKQRVMSPWEQHIIAYHESGHALVAESLTHADRVHRISITPWGIKETIEGDELRAIMAASRQQAHTQASSPQACPSSPAIPARVAPLNDREGARQVASLAALLPPPPAGE